MHRPRRETLQRRPNRPRRAVVCDDRSPRETFWHGMLAVWLAAELVARKPVTASELSVAMSEPLMHCFPSLLSPQPTAADGVQHHRQVGATGERASSEFGGARLTSNHALLHRAACRQASPVCAFIKPTPVNLYPTRRRDAPGVPGGVTVNLEACKDPTTPPPDPAPRCTTPPALTAGTVQDLTSDQCTRWGQGRHHTAGLPLGIDAACCACPTCLHAPLMLLTHPFLAAPNPQLHQLQCDGQRCGHRRHHPSLWLRAGD